MVKRHNRLLVAFHVVTDAVLGMVAFVFAYLIRFETGLIPVTRGFPPLEQYVNVLPFVALIVPLGFHFQGLYRLRRGRSRIDDFFNVLVGSIFAVVLGIVATLYFQAYYATQAQRDVGAFETFARHDDGQLLRHLVSLAFATNAGGIDDAEVSFRRLQHGIDRVAGRSGNGRNDDAIFAEYSIQQRRLSDVRRAGQHDDSTFAYELTHACRREQRG